jgi:glycosyltransferase involved in cell wall biosynthesis
VDERERAGWLEAADLFCLPSEGEIFPVSILEAWSVRTPVLTSDLPTLDELLGQARGGVTAPRHPRALADAILALLADPERLRAMGESGYTFWASRHTVERVAAAHEAVYASLTATEATACAA